MPEMDAVDSQQQKEINDLREVNKRQDGTLTSLLWVFVLFALIQFGGTAMFLSMFNSGFSDICPHKECPHHHQEK